MWDHVREHVSFDDVWGTTVVGAFSRRNLASSMDVFLLRPKLVRTYAWTITDPHSVEFVARWSGGRLIDPIAGTGYWCKLLTEVGVDCIAFDIHPPSEDHDDNHYHPNVKAHFDVLQMDAAQAVAIADRDRVLLLSWPSYGGDEAYRALSAYQGDRVIYIGEGEGGCTGDADFHQALSMGWNEVAAHAPVQFYGIHDIISVFERRRAITAT